MHILNILFIFGYCGAILADNSCIFEHPSNGIIDLTSIGLRNGQPRFRDLLTNQSSYYTYSFNPCYSFVESGCRNAAVCQISSDGLYSFTLATQNTSRWALDSNSAPTLTYTYGSKTVAIAMVCSTTAHDELEVLGEQYYNHYSMRLRSRCACWNGCNRPKPSSTTHRTSPATTHTIYVSACRYHDSRYGTIDLSSIGSMTGIPVFKDVPSQNPDNYVWSYNPCYKFSEYNCHNVAGCQIDKTHGISYAIGTQDYVYWINMNGTENLARAIVYPLTPNTGRLTVQLICDQSISSHQLQVLGETSFREYSMQLRSPCACWNGCTQPTSTPTPFPFNWNFLIIAGGIGGVVFLLFCTMITCLFCSKPKRRSPAMLVDEKTPFINNTDDCRKS